MFVRKCDRCGVDSTQMGDKNFLNFEVSFKNFKTSLDFCPKCWGEVGSEIVKELEGEKQEFDENV